MKVKKIFRWTKEFHPAFDMDYALRVAELFGLPLNKKSSALSTGYKSILKNVIALSINQRDIFQHVPIIFQKPVKPDSMGVPGFSPFGDVHMSFRIPPRLDARE